MSELNKPLHILISKYKQLRLDTLTYMEQIITIKNRLTYLTNEKVDNIISTLLDSSRFSLLFSEELYEISDKFTKTQNEIKTIIENICDLLLKPNENNCLIIYDLFFFQ